MNWRLTWSQQAGRDLAALPPDVAGRIARKVEIAAGNPKHFFAKLVGQPRWRMRVGDYRVIAKIDADARSIEISTVGHRRNVYDDR
ncbi:MAG: type II toxin-antitoxin system RelE family toxin [Thermoplasmatota archaeon]